MNLDNNDFQENSGFAILQNKEIDNSNNGKPSKEKYIKLMNNKVKYSIEEELNSILYRITLGKLLDISPKIYSRALDELNDNFYKFVEFLLFDHSICNSVDDLKFDKKKNEYINDY
ncbi:hypothetical protein H8356DRAFT_925411 [Neocallimastix lanati (nom. inval.)]|nr:hypothetical protein H8356DRAFT_925411 [Neocallimastix sp. JGI-2020a]